MLLQKVRKFILKSYLSPVVGIGFLFVSCNKDNIAASSIENAKGKAMIQSAALDGEQLFSGLVFAHGPLLDLLPELKKSSELMDLYLKSDQEKQVRDLVRQEAVENVANNYPGFFTYFKTEIESGEHARIANALDSATTLAFYGVCEMYDLNTDHSNFVDGELRALDNDNFIEVQRISEALMAGELTKEEAVSDINDIFPNLKQSIISNLISQTDYQIPSQGACLAINIAIAVVIVGYFGIVLAAHTVIAARYLVVLDVDVHKDDPEEQTTRNNISLKLVDEIATTL